MVSSSKIIGTDPLSFTLLMVNVVIFLGSLMGLLIKQGGEDRFPLFISALSVFIAFSLLAYLRVKYLKWLLSFPTTVKARLNKDDEKYRVNDVDIIGWVCYSYSLDNKEYTSYSAVKLSVGFKKYLENHSEITLGIYPKLRLSVVKEAYFL